MIIPYNIAAYRRADHPAFRLLNLYAEKTPTNEGQVALLPRPALQAYQTHGTGPIRGLYTAPNTLESALFSVSAGQLFKNGAAIGVISGSGRVSMASTLDTLLVATGEKLYRSDGTTVVEQAFPDDAGVSVVRYFGGYVLAARADTRYIYFTLDPTTWDGLDYLAAEQSTGPIVGMAVVSDQLWVFCDRVTEIMVLTGNADAPLQALQGRVFDKGALTRDSIVNLDNTIYWVGHDRTVYRGGNVPTRISDHGIEERLAQSDLADVSAWAYYWNGHAFFVLHTSEGTFAYDVPTQQWHELGSYGRERWRAQTGLLYGREYIAGDDRTGQLWKLHDGIYSDGDQPIQAVFSAYVNQRGFVDNVYLDCSVGVTGGADDEAGTLEMRTSRDDGRTWNDWRDTSLGLQGKYRQRPGFRRVGMVDDGNMLMEFRITDPRPRTVNAIRLNDGGGGRSR